MEGELHIGLCHIFLDICGGATAGCAEKEREKIRDAIVSLCACGIFICGIWIAAIG